MQVSRLTLWRSNGGRMTFSCDISARKTQGTLYEWLSVVVVAVMGLVSVVSPLLRMFFKLSIEYNEGWNVYNAARITHHVALYGQQYSGTRSFILPCLFLSSHGCTTWASTT